MLNLESFWKGEACGQTVLPYRSILIGQKMVENAKTEKFKCDILGDFQTLCCCCSGWYSCLRFHLNPFERTYVVINRWWVSKALIQMNLNAKKEQKGKSGSLHVYLWSEIWMNLYPINRVKYIINWRQMHSVLNEPSTRVVL